MRKVFIKLIFLLAPACLFAQQWGLDINIPQGKPVSVTVSHDGEKLLLETVEGENHNFYEYRRSDTSWVDPVLIVSKPKIMAPSYNYNNSVIYFSGDLGSGNYDIYIMRRQGDGWSDPQPVKGINTGADELSPSVDAYNEFIYFIRKSQDQDCGKMYYAMLKGDSIAGEKPLILPGDFSCSYMPRIFYDSRTFLFSSRGEKEKVFSIYYTKKITEGVWFVPKPLVFNDTKSNYFSPALDYKSKRLLFIKADSRLKNYSLEAMHVPGEISPDPVLLYKGTVTNSSKGQTTESRIFVLNPTTNYPIAKYYTKQDGKFEFFLNPANDYILEFSGEGLSTKFLPLKARKLKNLTTQELDVDLFDRINLQLNVFDSAIFSPLVVDIKTFNLTTGKEMSIQPQLSDTGRYVVVLPIGNKYRFVFTNEFYKTDSLDFDLSKTVIYSNFEKDIELKPLLKKVVLHVVNVKTGKGVSTEVEVINLATKERYKTYVKTDNQGNVVLFLKKGGVYELNITPKGYTFYNTTLDLEQDTLPDQIEAKIEPLTTETKLEFHNITFETNSAELNDASFAELNRLVELMKKNPSIKVEISAHTDDVGSEAYNMKLSLRRAQSVVNYLKEHGISPDRMIAKGYGESKPLVPNDTEEHRAMNRRVELRILEINE